MGIYNDETIDNTIETLEIAIDLYGKKGISGDKKRFPEYLDNNNINHIAGRIDHPQTKGILEKVKLYE